MPAAIVSTSNGSTSTAAPPATSSVDVPAGGTTADPGTSAGKTGSRKPSKPDEWANPSAAAYSAGRSSPGTKPGKRTAPVTPVATSPQPVGPATTSGTGSRRAAIAVARRRRFLRGS